MVVFFEPEEKCMIDVEDVSAIQETSHLINLVQKHYGTHIYLKKQQHIIYVDTGYNEIVRLYEEAKEKLCSSNG